MRQVFHFRTTVSPFQQMLILFDKAVLNGVEACLETTVKRRYMWSLLFVDDPDQVLLLRFRIDRSRDIFSVVDAAPEL